VSVGGSGSEGLATLDSGANVDLVLTDFHMPQTDGTTLANEIRRRWPGRKIGLITGTLDAAEGQALVFDVILTKPVTSGRLDAAPRDRARSHDDRGARPPAAARPVQNWESRIGP